VLRRIFGPEREEKQDGEKYYDEELHDFSS
jgi:hypothetical protein